MPMRPASGSQVSLLSRFLSFPTARRRVRRPRSSVAIPAESYPRYSSRLSASRIGAAAGPRPTTPTIPHIFFSDASAIRHVRHWNVIMERLLQPKECPRIFVDWGHGRVSCGVTPRADLLPVAPFLEY